MKHMLMRFLRLWVVIGCVQSMQAGPIAYYLQDVSVEDVPSGIEGIDAIYVINLEERPERWQKTQEQFVQWGLYPHRFPAINGWKIPIEEQKTLIDPRSHVLKHLALNGGELGCLLSHISLYYLAYQRGWDAIWICEDDVQINDKITALPSFVKTLQEKDPYWCILYTDFTRTGAALNRHRPEQSPYASICHDIVPGLARIHGRFGTHSMIISRRGVEELLSYFFERYFWAPIDIDIHYANVHEYSVKESITSIRAGSISDTQPSSALRYGK